MFKKLFGSMVAILELVGLGAVLGYGLESGKDFYHRNKKKSNKNE